MGPRSMCARCGASKAAGTGRCGRIPTRRSRWRGGVFTHAMRASNENSQLPGSARAHPHRARTRRTHRSTVCRYTCAGVNTNAGTWRAGSVFDGFHAQTQHAAWHAHLHLVSRHAVEQRLAHRRSDRDLPLARIDLARADELVLHLFGRLDVDDHDTAADVGATGGACRPLDDARVLEHQLDAADLRLDVRLLITRRIQRGVFAEVLI